MEPGALAHCVHLQGHFLDLVPVRVEDQHRELQEFDVLGRYREGSSLVAGALS